MKKSGIKTGEIEINFATVAQERAFKRALSKVECRAYVQKDGNVVRLLLRPESVNDLKNKLTDYGLHKSVGMWAAEYLYQCPGEWLRFEIESGV
jgi:hypothetical protein